MDAFRRLRPALLPLLLVGAACSSQVDYIALEPAQVTFKSPNEQVWMIGRAMSHTGTHYSKLKVTWSVKDESVAKVDETGKVTPVKSGRTELVARLGDVTAAVPVEVLFAEKLEVSPANVELTMVGDSKELVTRVFDHEGRELRDRAVTFKSLRPEVVSMGQNAAFAVGKGEGQVEVKVGTLTRTVAVKVLSDKQRAE